MIGIILIKNLLELGGLVTLKIGLPPLKESETMLRDLPILDTLILQQIFGAFPMKF